MAHGSKVPGAANMKPTVLQLVANILGSCSGVGLTANHQSVEKGLP